jgi:hypothetical protein
VRCRASRRVRRAGGRVVEEEGKDEGMRTSSLRLPQTALWPVFQCWTWWSLQRRKVRNPFERSQGKKEDRPTDRSTIRSCRPLHTPSTEVVSGQELCEEKGQSATDGRRGEKKAVYCLEHTWRTEACPSVPRVVDEVSYLLDGTV